MDERVTMVSPRKRELNPVLCIGGLRGGEIQIGKQYLSGLALVKHPKSLSGDGVVLYLTAPAIAEHQNSGWRLELCAGSRRGLNLARRGRGLLTRSLFLPQLLYFGPSRLNFLNHLVHMTLNCQKRGFQ